MSSKQSKLNTAASQYQSESQPFQEYSDEIFAALESEDGRLPIMNIRADITQPRRIIPHEIRGNWDGAASGVPALLDKWSKASVYTPDGIVRSILTGKSAINSLATTDPVVISFLKLLNLAANIRDIGLQQPIGVVRRGADYRIVYGERRWMAFHVMSKWLGGKWDNIPAKVLTVGEWELAKMQAGENFQRATPNAIGIARQFLKLLMIARSDADGAQYDGWNALVVDCDRPYYAQAANGEIHRIPRGMGPQFEQALDISTDQMRRYRKLAALTDDYAVNNAIWNLGDALNWAEGFMRDISQLDIETIRQILNDTDGYTVTIGTVSQTEERFREAISATKMSESEEDVEPETTATETPSTPQTTPETTPDDTPPNSGDDIEAGDDDADAQNPYRINGRVTVQGHGAGTIRYIKNNQYGVYLDSSQTTHYYDVSQLSLLDESPKADKPKEPPSLKDVSTSDGGKIRILRAAAFEDERIHNKLWPPQYAPLWLQRRIMAFHGKNQHTTLCYVPECGWIALDHDADKLARSLNNVKQSYILFELHGTRVCLVQEASRSKFQSALNDTNAWYILYDALDQHTAELTEYFDEVLVAAYNAANSGETPEDPDAPHDGAGVSEAADDFDFEALLDAVQLLADWVGLSDEGATLEDCKHFNEEAIGEMLDIEGLPHVKEVLKRYAAASANIFEAAQTRIETRLEKLLRQAQGDTHE